MLLAQYPYAYEHSLNNGQAASGPASRLLRIPVVPGGCRSGWIPSVRMRRTGPGDVHDDAATLAVTLLLRRDRA
jgi:hypothetical protein